MKKIVGFVVAGILSVTVLTVAPVSNLVPQERQATASATAVGRVHNWNYSDKSIKVFENRDGKGDWQWVAKGGTVKTINGDWKNGHAESVWVPRRCRSIIDPVIGPSKVIDRRGRTTGFTWNFPVWMMSQDVIVEVHC